MNENLKTLVYLGSMGLLLLHCFTGMALFLFGIKIAVIGEVGPSANPYRFLGTVLIFLTTWAIRDLCIGWAGNFRSAYKRSVLRNAERFEKDAEFDKIDA